MVDMAMISCALGTESSKCACALTVNVLRLIFEGFDVV